MAHKRPVQVQAALHLAQANSAQLERTKSQLRAIIHACSTTSPISAMSQMSQPLKETKTMSQMSQPLKETKAMTSCLEKLEEQFHWRSFEFL